MYKRKNLLDKVFQNIPILMLLLIVFMTYANTVDDLDFWWHLKSGQFIFEIRSIPQKDYFAHTTEVPESINIIGKDEVSPTELPSGYQSNALKGNWLSQLIFYLVYLVGGFIGIGILKSIVFVFTYFILYLTMLRRGADQLISFLVLCLISFIGIEFNYTRPQIFSFLLFSCVLYTLYDFRNGGKSIYFLPALMLLWTNLHGGVILGVLVIITFTFTEFLKYLFKNKFSITSVSSFTLEKLRTSVLFSFISILASLINPNLYKTFVSPFVFQRSLFATVEEFHRPMLYEYHAYWFMLCLVIISTMILAKKKKLDMNELFLSFIVILPSLISIRFIIFFALGTGVFLSNAMSYAGTRLKEFGFLKKILHKQLFFKIYFKDYFPFLMVVVLLIIMIKIGSSGEILKFDMREKRYPSGAAAFIKQNIIPGNMFNIYNWGGYLMWHLYPDYRVFIDGRCLNETAFFHYNQILKAAKGNITHIPLWERLLDAYSVNFIITSAVSSSGKIIRLVDELYVSVDWKLVYTDGKSMIFLRNVPKNYTIINRYELSKGKIDDEIIDECKQGIKDTPATWGYYETLGYMYMKKNRLNDTLKMFQKYLAMNPHNEKVRYYHNLIKEYMKRRKMKHR